MVIVHLAPSAPYNEGWGYQENLLTKYQARLGHQVILIITNSKNTENGVVETSMEDYMSPDGFRVIRKSLVWSQVKGLKIFAHFDVFDDLIALRPDLIFYHGLVNATIYQATRYKKEINPDVIIVQDNHLDYNIGSVHQSGWKMVVIRHFYRLFYRMNDHYVSRVYGVTPWRKEYAEKVFGVPASKTDVLIMGADDEKIRFSKREEIRQNIRKTYGVQDDDFLVVSGGKIDKRKKVDLLVQAFSGIQVKAKLLLFGSIMDDVKEGIMPLIERNNNIIYLGWIEADSVYDYFFASDLALFPGQHSVLWEQACAAKIPCVFARWPGMEHVNNGGNADFIDEVTVEGIQNKIREMHFTDKYFAMKSIAESEKTDIYLYSRIAEKSLECVC